nr:ribosome-binding factor A [Propionibacteriales bacterium]
LPESAAYIEDLLARARREDAEVAAAAARATYAGDADPYKRPDDVTGAQLTDESEPQPADDGRT